MEKVLAKCIKTYPCEDGMQAWCDGEIEPSEVKIFYKGRKYLVAPQHYNKEYYMLIEDKAK